MGNNFLLNKWLFIYNKRRNFIQWLYFSICLSNYHELLILKAIYYFYFYHTYMQNPLQWFIRLVRLKYFCYIARYQESNRYLIIIANCNLSHSLNPNSITAWANFIRGKIKCRNRTNYKLCDDKFGQFLKLANQ